MPQPTIQQAFNLALQHHQAGRLGEARKLYEQILDRQPNHAGALQYLGVLAHQQGQNEVAVDLIRRAIALAPNLPEPYNNLGLALKELGQIDQAIAAYRQALKLRPNYPGAFYNLGIGLRAKGQINDAITAYRQAIALRPGYVEALANLGNALSESGQHAEAITVFQEAVALRPNDATACGNLGNILIQAGKLDLAIDAYQRAISINPAFPEAQYNLANALRDHGQMEEAIVAYRRAITLEPGYAGAHNNLGEVLRSKGDIDDAIDAFGQAIRINPADANAHYNLGNTLREKGLLDKAVSAYQQAIALRPDHADAHNNLGLVFMDHGQHELAIEAFRRAISINPQDPEAQVNLGHVFKDSGRLDEAMIALRKAIALGPDLPNAHNFMGLVFKKGDRLEESIASYRKAIDIDPSFAEAQSNLGDALYDQARLDEAIAIFRTAMATRPTYTETHSNLIFAMHHHPDLDAAAIAREQTVWNDQHAEPLRQLIQPHANDPDPERRLRIGYVSPDFRNHTVGYNLLPLFQRHDHTQFEITCYADLIRADEMTGQFQQHADRWRDIRSWSHQRVADQIREDQIDILLDLTLHTAGNRLLTFARKPAPVQVTFAGYPASTGLKAIDYRLSDPYLDPPGMDESIYSEKTVRLPHSFWCYDPHVETPIPFNPLPAIRNGFITFGCPNSFCKINERVLDLWAKVMLQVPGSRLLLLAPQGSHQQRTMDYMARAGIEPDRIEFAGRRPRLDYLQLYHRIDLGLDSFPYNGHTTSLDSFWMGVPVITLVGQTSVSRAGWCLVSNLGLQELAASSPEQFVQIAVDLAGDLPRLQSLRASLRQRMEQSPLMDAGSFTRGIEAAYRQMWRGWCIDGRTDDQTLRNL